MRIRDQPVAVIGFDPSAIRAVGSPTHPWTDVGLALSTIAASGPTVRNTGPFTRVCERTLMNYETSGEAARVWTPPAGPGTRAGSLTYCSSVDDCAAARIDILFLVAEDLVNSSALFGFAAHHTSYLGLNIGILDVGALQELTAEAVHDFIRDVYDTQSAEHFGDGHLGFVLLIGDAYADDNQTVMIPAYDGYGGTEVASDHYYACVSGDDDFEDVMIGRFSVGTLSELSTVAGKAANYMPQDPEETWHERVLLVGGLFYTTKDGYIALFDEYEEMLPDYLTVDRIYRHDFPNMDQCALSIVDAVNDGYLFVNFAGDGWKFNWHETLTTGYIPLMTNSDRLPIVLSMACMTGWFDNITDTDPAGSYDCFAEQIVNANRKGAIACLAAPRASDGGIFRTITKKLYQAAFQENCVFLGETVAVAKLLHLQDGGELDYARHFNLFGDPGLIFAWEMPPSDKPDLVLRPHDVRWSSELPSVGEDLIITVPVHNRSSEPAPDVTVRVTRHGDGPLHEVETVIPLIDGWSGGVVELAVPMPDLGDHVIEVAVDPDAEISELHEDNNAFQRATYVYPHVAGFPVDIGTAAHGLCTAFLSGPARHVLVSGHNARLFALADDGSISWQTPLGVEPLDFGREIAPAVGDIDGDGVNEVVFTERMALTAVDEGGGELWTIPIQEPLGCPILADADGDGDLDVLISTIGTFGSPCKIVAVDESGQEVWAHVVSSEKDLTTSPVAGDFDLDGSIDVAYGTSSGEVVAISCAQSPPVLLWGPVDLGSSEIRSAGLADVDGDGLLELVAADDTVVCLNAEDGTDLGWDIAIGPGVTALALGDVDDDGVAEVLAGTSSGDLHMIARGTVAWTAHLAGTPGGSAAVADVDGDESPEILIATDEGRLHVLTAEGEDYVAAMPIPGGSNTPFVGDLTGDGRQEVVVSSSGGLVFAFGFQPAAPGSPPEWAGLGGSARRVGVHVQPLAGHLPGNTVLAGRYRVIEDVVIGPTDTLTLASETIVEFESDPQTSLEVGGTIQALGNSGHDVVLTGEAPSSPASWGGLELRPNAVAHLASCRVTGAQTAIDGDRASVTVLGCEFAGNGTGLELTGCTLEARNSAFSQSDSVGMCISGGTGRIIGCAFDANGAAGMECTECESYEIRGSTFTGTIRGDGARLARYSDAIVDSCVFANNASNGLRLKRSSPTVTRSSFIDNGPCGIRCLTLADPYVSWCTVSGNDIGVVAESGSHPNLGNDMYPESGYNSIMDNETAAVANCVSSSMPVFARRNWWGAPTPYGRLFIGYVAYAPWLTEPPAKTDTEPRTDDLPLGFRLLQNAPNPFNPTTTITFDVPPAVSDLDLSIYDVSGRLVATLHSGECLPGTHTVVWDGRDDFGNGVASGTYFVRMSAPDYTATRKIILLK